MAKTPTYVAPPGGGRPPMEDPMQRIGKPVRGLVSPNVRKAFDAAMQVHGCTQSELIRLALYNRFRKDGVLQSEGIENDHTWDDLKEKGLI